MTPSHPRRFPYNIFADAYTPAVVYVFVDYRFGRDREQGKTGGSAMDTSDDVIREILKDLDGTATLNAWQAALLQHVKEKVAALIVGSGGMPPKWTPPPCETSTDCAGAAGGWAV